MKLFRARMIATLVPLMIFMLQIGNVSASEDLVKIAEELNSKEWKVRLNAVEKLDPYNEDALNMLLKVVSTRSEYWPVKIKAILLLGESKDPRAKKLLLTTFNNTFQNWECPSIKSYTAIALGNFRGDKKVVDTLIEGIHDPELLTREASMRSLGKIGDLRAIDYIVEALDDSSVAVRLSAIDALGDLGDSEAIKHLRQHAEKEQDDIVKRHTLMLLEELQRGSE